MQTEKEKLIIAETHILSSVLLDRDVNLNIYFPSGYVLQGDMHLLLINDGQDLETMNFENILSDLYSQKKIAPLFCVGIECGR